MTVTELRWAISLLVTGALFSCNSPDRQARTAMGERTVGLVAFSESMDSMLVYMEAQTESFYHCKAVILPRSTVPQSAYYAPGKRYRADTILNFLQTFSKDSVIFIAGFTDVDISASVGKHGDWGVFGLGLCPGPTCIISSYRLGNDQPSVRHLRTRVRNVLLHELGHNFGLPHCSNAGCLMKDANGKLASVEGDSVTLCRSCRSELGL